MNTKRFERHIFTKIYEWVSVKKDKAILKCKNIRKEDLVIVFDSNISLENKAKQMLLILITFSVTLGISDLRSILSIK